MGLFSCLYFTWGCLPVCVCVCHGHKHSLLKSSVRGLHVCTCVYIYILQAMFCKVEALLSFFELHIIKFSLATCPHIHIRINFWFERTARTPRNNPTLIFHRSVLKYVLWYTSTLKLVLTGLVLPRAVTRRWLSDYV